MALPTAKAANEPQRLRGPEPAKQVAGQDYRYERKFYITQVPRQTVELMVKLHPALFTEAYPKRHVNNIYFDSEELENYTDNVEGSPHRQKVRIRWYGELFGPIGRPVLEFKIKSGALGRKESYPLKPFTIDRNFDKKSILAAIEDSAIPAVVKLQLRSLQPVLLNRYTRKYFISANKGYRITIDTDLIFYQIHYKNGALLNRVNNNTDVILEVKYDQARDDHISYITNNFPFRLSKSSKYVIGVNNVSSAALA